MGERGGQWLCVTAPQYPEQCLWARGLSSEVKGMPPSRLTEQFVGLQKSVLAASCDEKDVKAAQESWELLNEQLLECLSADSVGDGVSPEVLARILRVACEDLSSTLLEQQLVTIDYISQYISVCVSRDLSTAPADMHTSSPTYISLLDDDIASVPQSPLRVATTTTLTGSDVVAILKSVEDVQLPPLLQDGALVERKVLDILSTLSERLREK